MSGFNSFSTLASYHISGNKTLIPNPRSLLFSPLLSSLLCWRPELALQSSPMASRCCSTSLGLGSRHPLRRRPSSHLLLRSPSPAIRSPPSSLLRLSLTSSAHRSLTIRAAAVEKAASPAVAVAGKRTDIKKILVLGAGPIVIGQACEFDYSGTQAVKALRDEGYDVVLVNSNPATIMTDPNLANRTYVGPMTPDLIEDIIAAERPDALLPTMGGQTALNLAVALSESGALDRYGVELIGAKLDAIMRAEDRDLFKKSMAAIGLKTPPSGIGNTMEECAAIADEIGGFPLIIRPA